jgi:hypothetical protein
MGIVRTMGVSALIIGVVGTGIAVSPTGSGASAITPRIEHPNIVGQGYVMVGQDGGAYAFGNAGFYGSTYSLNGESAQAWFTNPIVAGTVSPSKNGYWMVNVAGVTCAFGSAEAAERGGTTVMGTNNCFDPPQSIVYTGNVVGIAAPDDDGYWQVTSTGAVYSLGDAPFYGSLSTPPSGSSIVGMAVTGDEKGYWLVAANGAVYAFGDAQYIGGMNGTSLNKPIVGIAADDAASTSGDSWNDGYWLVGSDGGIYSFNAPYLGSTGGNPPVQSITAITSSSTGAGYLIVGGDGGVFSSGNFAYQGSMAGSGLSLTTSPYPNAVIGMGGN